MTTLDSASDSTSIRVHASISSQLQRTQAWVRFLSTVGFVGSGLWIVFGFIHGSFVASRNLEQAWILVLFPLTSVLYFFPSLYLLRYANGIRQFVTSGEQTQLETALDAQRSFWKFVGLATAIWSGFLLAFLITFIAIFLVQLLKGLI